MINSRKLEDLTPELCDKCKQFISKCEDAGVPVSITSTYRDFESQDALYAQGRTTPGEIVTKAKGGESFHNYRVAFDFVPKVDGKAEWSREDLFSKCGAIAESIGLEWSGNWVKFKELAHCQLTNGKSLKDFQKESEDKNA